MKKQLKFWLANIDAALEMLASLPPERLELASWRWDSHPTAPQTAPTCKTIACFGGWLPYWPHFAALGAYVGDDCAPRIRKRGVGWAARDVAEYLFGDSTLFNARDTEVGLFTAHWCERWSSGYTDHACVVNRLQHRRFVILHQAKITKGLKSYDSD